MMTIGDISGVVQEFGQCAQDFMDGSIGIFVVSPFRFNPVFESASLYEE